MGGLVGESVDFSGKPDIRPYMLSVTSIQTLCTNIEKLSVISRKAPLECFDKSRNYIGITDSLIFSGIRIILMTGICNQLKAC